MQETSSIFDSNVKKLEDIFTVTGMDGNYIIGHAKDNNDVVFMIKLFRAGVKEGLVAKLFIYSKMLYEICGDLDSSCFLGYERSWGGKTCEPYTPIDGLDDKVLDLYKLIINTCNFR